MDASKMKNMIIIKNLPSNIVDEAFIVLKANKKIKAFKAIENDKESKSNEKRDSKDYIIKEAEMIISNYLSNIETNNTIKGFNMKQFEKKYKRLKTITIILCITLIIIGIINIG